MRRLPGVAVVLAAGLIVGCRAQGLDGRLAAGAAADIAENAGIVADAASGCGPAEAPKLGQHNVPIEMRMGSPIRPPILSGKEVSAQAARDAGYTATLPTDTAGLDLRYRATVTGDLVSYFADSRIGEEDTTLDLMKSGGMMVVERPTSGVDLATRAEVVLGDDGASVAVGSTIATMILGDEWASGVRPYFLFWTDRGSDWTLIAGLDDPAAVIDVARSIACQ